MRNAVLPAISICLVVFSFPQYICLDLISTLFGSYSFSLFPASCLNACLSAGLSLWLWASLAFLTLKDFPSRAACMNGLLLLYKWYPLFSSFSRHLFWSIVRYWNLSSLFMQALSSVTPSNTDGEKVSHRLPSWAHSVKRPDYFGFKIAENLLRTLPLTEGEGSG